jgi:nucleoside-diphosphate-sugar epimerase
MRVFVAGATGAVGRRLIPLLIGAGHRVTGVARSPEKAAQLERAGAAPARVDIFDREAVMRSVVGHDAVINVATHIPASSRAFLPGAFRENDRIRRIASRLLADAAIAARAERFVQESFAPAYPDRGDDWIHESTSLEPARYARAVLDAEASAAHVTAAGRVGVVLRFAFFYGSDTSYTRDTVRFVRKGRAPTFGSPSGFVSAISTSDAASAVVAALHLPEGIYNVADDEPLRRRAHFDTLADALGVGPPSLPPAWLAKLAGGIGETVARSLRIANRKLRDESDWQPAYPSAREGWRAVVSGRA